MDIMTEFTENYKDALAKTLAECRSGVRLFDLRDYAEGWKDIDNPFDHIEDMDADRIDWVAGVIEDQIDQLEKIFESMCKLGIAKRRLEDIADYED